MVSTPEIYFQAVGEIVMRAGQSADRAMRLDEECGSCDVGGGRCGARKFPRRGLVRLIGVDQFLSDSFGF